MVYVTLLGCADGAEEFGTLGEALESIRGHWMEEPEGPQTLEVADAAGWPLAYLFRPQGDAELCITVYADGTVERHRCHYVCDGERFVRCNVDRVPQGWASVA